MKSLRHVLFILLAAIIFVSCEKIFGELDIQTLSGKWLIAGSGEYESFEFKEDFSYVVIRIVSSEEEIIAGTYEIKGLNKVLMDGFGKVKVTSIDEEMIFFTLTLEEDPDTELELSATKVY